MSSIAWLTTLDLEDFILKCADKKTTSAFLGVYPIDCLPKTVSQLPVLFIINTNTSNLPGQHWKAVYVSSQRIGEVFDSLAMPLSIRLEQWMNSFTRKWTISTMTLQNPLSPTCGGYVLYFVMTRLKHKSLTSCLAPFTINVNDNDAFIEDYFTRHLQ